MNFLKNAAVASKYQVSDPTVGKWIKAAEEGKNNLQLKKVNNKLHILDSSYNHQILSLLSDKGSKYRNKIGYQKIYPKPDIYKIYDEFHLLELIINLKKGIFPYRYSYFGDGAHLARQLADFTADYYYYSDDNSKAIDSSLDYLASRLRKYKEINIVNLFAENTQPAILLAKKFQSISIPVKFTLINASQSMLDLFNSELNSICPEISCQAFVRDIFNSPIRDVLYKNRLASKGSCNLILFLDYVLGNSENRDIVLKNLSTSMDKHDYLLVDAEIRSSAYYDNAFNFMNQPTFTAVEDWVLSQFNLGKDVIERGVQHDPSTDSMVRTFTLKKDVDIEFKVGDYTDIVSWKKGQQIKGIILHSFELDDLIKELRQAKLMVSYVSSDPEADDEVLAMCEIPHN